MSEAKQLKIEDDREPKKIKEPTGINEYLDYTITDELIIGLCGPIGSDINFVSESLKEILEDTFGYDCIEIKLSDFIRMQFEIPKKEKKFSYYEELINKGNELRNQFGNDILSKLIVHEITKDRQSKSKTDKELVKKKRICYIINSIKHISEYRLLKRVYQNIFYFIGVFSPLEVRKENLSVKGIENPDIERLVKIDSEQVEDHGQKVSKTFPNADYFLRIEDSNDKIVNDKIQRFLDLVFGTKITTPTYQETAMYMASSASANSACLSRQVGASITNKLGDIISVGWNDVPKYGGNLYTENDLNGDDHRCINKSGGKCFNDEEKNELINLITEKLVEEEVINKEKSNDVFNILKDSRIRDLIEFSRAVHAEMHAMINATQKSGSEILGGKLFCTTYPCHNCARHIVAAGIKEVYYIEPYKKSLALKLHSDSITERFNTENRVKVLMYDGVSPKRYIDLFKINDAEKRKKDGKKLIVKRKKASPRKSVSLEAIPFLEKKATEELNKNGKFDKIIN
ncbi:anti-phage dCTP deaminase [uncultured Aquimarina sp.]|uniref:anti-phage dCTP deaminase n=1 Tax=uncultured Aquimarina sp. TaxID=575652 RepID=UPI0026272680|nr:anti-phage dCTP deaminase [uncultured Aquimarina sp.]